MQIHIEASASLREYNQHLTGIGSFLYLKIQKVEKEFIEQNDSRIRFEV